MSDNIVGTITRCPACSMFNHPRATAHLDGCENWAPPVSSSRGAEERAARRTKRTNRRSGLSS